MPDTAATEAALLASLRDLDARFPGQAFTAKLIATGAGLHGHRRLGRKASRGNWSGKMSPALTAAATLRRMHRAGTVTGFYDLDNGRWTYRLPAAGDEPYTSAPKPPRQAPAVRSLKPPHLLPVGHPDSTRPGARRG